MLAMILRRSCSERGELCKVQPGDPSFGGFFETSESGAHQGAAFGSVWDAYENYVDEKTLNVNIRRLREKIEDDPKEPVYIKTVFGIGYK